MKVRPVHEAARRYAKRPTMAFLDGERDLTWITAVLPPSGLSNHEILMLLLPLRNYGEAYRSQDLFSWPESVDG